MSRKGHRPVQAFPDVCSHAFRRHVIIAFFKLRQAHTTDTVRPLPHSANSDEQRAGCPLVTYNGSKMEVGVELRWSRSQTFDGRVADFPRPFLPEFLDGVLLPIEQDSIVDVNLRCFVVLRCHLSVVVGGVEDVFFEWLDQNLRELVRRSPSNQNGLTGPTEHIHAKPTVQIENAKVSKAIRGGFIDGRRIE